ncbi:hypothetical protein TrRE_jg9425, partial [Triparma retinervis]
MSERVEDHRTGRVDDSDDNENGTGSKINAKMKKLAHKEKSVYEMIDMLNEKLEKRMLKFTRREDYCSDDLNPDVETTYKDLLTTERKELNEGIEESLGMGGRRNSMLFGAGGGFHSIEDEQARLARAFTIPDPSRLTWRDPHNVPTEAGRRLESTFTSFLQAEKSGRKKGMGGSQSIKKNPEERKRDRKDMERILYSNSDHHSSRAANNLRYELPEAVAMAVRSSVVRGSGSVRVGGLESTAAASSVDNLLSSSLGPSLAATESSRVRFTFDAKFADPYDGREKWPIPLGGYDMKPKLLLELACEKMTLPDGELVLKKLCISKMARNIYVYMYWYVHCRFFQENSDVEQQYLLSKVAAIYTTMLSSRSLEANKDFFFMHFPFVLSQAIILGFKYLCPGNQSLFTASFKNILYLTAAQLLSGVDVCPGSVSFIRHNMFPEDVMSDDLESNTLPALTFGGAGGGGGG